jgi:hypothetical protein
MRHVGTAGRVQAEPNAEVLRAGPDHVLQRKRGEPGETAGARGDHPGEEVIDLSGGARRCLRIGLALYAR